MKFVRFDGGKTGIVVDANGLRVIDIGASLDRLRTTDQAAADAIANVLRGEAPQSWVSMIGLWDDVKGAFEALEAMPAKDLVSQPFSGAAIEPPLASPAVRIFAMGSNTTDHIIRAFKVMIDKDLTAEQARQPKTEGALPFGFMLWPSTIVGHGAVVAPPAGTQKFDYEAECAVYVKRGGKNLQTVDLWGYTAFNDLGVRDSHLGLVREAQPGPFSFNMPKNFDSSNACGPWVSVDEHQDLGTLRCRLSVNGELRQDWVLSDMIYSFDETLVYLSKSLTLQPGDMLSSGTGAGVALESGAEGSRWLKPGDVIELTLDGVATLRNVVGRW